MIPKMLRFFDHHRLVLVLVLLLLFCLILFSIHAFSFLNYPFSPLSCEEIIDDTTCFHKKSKIFKEPSQAKAEFFHAHEAQINSLIKKYNLPKFSIYTAYYYEVASTIDYNLTGNYADLQEFFTTYSKTYDLFNHYQKFNFYYQIFYPYKID